MPRGAFVGPRKHGVGAIPPWGEPDRKGGLASSHLFVQCEGLAICGGTGLVCSSSSADYAFESFRLIRRTSAP